MSYYNATEKAEALRRIADRSADHEIVQTCKDAADELDEQTKWADEHFAGCKKLVDALLPNAAWVSLDTVHEASGRARWLQARISELEAELSAKAVELQAAQSGLRIEKHEREKLEADNERLQGIVEKLPKTADGVTVVPGMMAWGAFRDGVVEGAIAGLSPHCSGKQLLFVPAAGEYDPSDPHIVNFVDGDCLFAARSVIYSTREAAEAAASGKGEG